MEDTRFKISQYACAVLLIVSSIAMVAYQVIDIDDVASGLLYYVAQSFLLAGSIFGLDQYVRIISRRFHDNPSDKPPPDHPNNPSTECPIDRYSDHPTGHSSDHPTGHSSDHPANPSP